MYLLYFFRREIIMVNFENETKKIKAREMRMRKPLHRELNYESICDWFYEAMEECSMVAYTKEDYESLIDALDGDDEEAREFQMCFSNLEADMEMFAEDIRNENISKYFDLFLAVESSADGGLLGWDSCEQDYLPIDSYLVKYALEDVSKKIMRLTKEEILTLSAQCFGIVISFLSVRARYDSLKQTMDVIKEKNGNMLKAVKEIDRLYDEAWKKYREYPYGIDEQFMQAEFWREFDRVTSYLSQEVYIA